ncbi:hypothetical protein PoMZ_09295 [Pyricularia oryzae]|uniref:Uncharacterized protein n=1 Tax=Pyricularia oryzae TaxID=318829 RepID=A0A4P7MTP4_PYROR|nr:hypothetical protein PoMZ_09295 [Pyricularia oryzae]
MFYPQRRAHTPGRTLQVTTNNATADKQHDRRGPPIPLDVLAQRGQDLRVREQVAVDRGQHRGGHLVEAQRAARDDLAAELEGEQRDGQAHKHVVLEAADRGGAVRADEPLPKRRRRVGLRQRRRDADERALHQEEQRQAGLARGAQEPGHAREEEAAQPKGRHGRQALDPQLGLVGGDVRGPEGQEEGVARLLVQHTIDTKTLAPENATLSQMPETPQHAKMGMSACARVTSCCNLASQD